MYKPETKFYADQLWRVKIASLVSILGENPYTRHPLPSQRRLLLGQLVDKGLVERLHEVGTGRVYYRTSSPVKIFTDEK